MEPDLIDRLQAKSGTGTVILIAIILGALVILVTGMIVSALEESAIQEEQTQELTGSVHGLEAKRGDERGRLRMKNREAIHKALAEKLYELYWFETIIDRNDQSVHTQSDFEMAKKDADEILDMIEDRL